MVVPALPPYPGVTAEDAQCIAQQAERFEVPELLLHAIRRKEAGKLGDNIARKFGSSRDMGPSQINSIWLSHFKRYGVGAKDLIGNFCVNLQASAYVLKTYYYKARGNWQEAIVSYNVGPNNQTPERRRLGLRYMRDVVADWNQLQRYATTYRPTIECFYAGASPAEKCAVPDRHSPPAQPAVRAGIFSAPSTVPESPAESAIE